MGFDTAMKGADGTEYIFVKCDSGNCDFSKVFAGMVDTTKAPTTSKATTKATTTSAATADDCAREAENHPSTGVTHDPACFTGGLGCNAYGKDCCQFCGFGHFPDCPSATEDSPAMGMSIEAASSGPAAGLVIGGVASAAFVAAAVVVGMNMKSKKVAAPDLQEGLLDNEVSMGAAERH